VVYFVGTRVIQVMPKLEFVIQSLNTSDGTLSESPRFKRAKHACLVCQAKKVRCSGTNPCDLCSTKNFDCVFKDPSASGKSVLRDKDMLDNKTRSKDDRSRRNSETSLPLSISTVESHPVLRKSTAIKTTRQPYFRWLGPTAIAPPANGTFRLLSINLRSKDSEDNRKAVVVQNRTTGSRFTNGVTERGISSSNVRNAAARRNQSEKLETVHERTETFSSAIEMLPETDPTLPLPPKEIFDQFGLTMSNYLPYLPWPEFEDRLTRGIIGECLLFAMASLSERLNHMPSSSAAATATTTSDGDGAGEPTQLSMAEKYSEAAKRLILPHLASPSIEVVYTLLLIAYCEFADDRDSGLWAWSGMAIRMCYDLGLHTAQNQHSGDDFHQKVFWAVVCLDRLISCGTGRNATIPDTDIEYELECGGTIEKSGMTRTDPFPYFCRLLILLGQVSNFINTRSRKTGIVVFSNNAVSPDSLDAMEKFVQFQQTVSDFYTTLPDDLLFDVQNFQDYTRMDQAQVFLLLHVWNQALVLAVHHPTLVYPKFKLDVASLMSNPHAGLTGTGAISIADMVAFADLIESKSFMANPFLSQPLHMAASAALVLWHTLPPSSPSHSVYTLQRTYNTCRKILDRMQKVWKGISWHSRTLDSLAASEPDVDLSTSAGYIITKDLGLVRNATIDETTRKWLVNEIEHEDSDDIYGLFIAGIIDDDKSSVSSQRFEAQNAQDGTAVVPKNSQQHTAEAEVNNPMPGHDYALPVRQGFTRQELREEDSFRSLLMRNLDQLL
jgi:Fungal specific transcription factor domain/Fungal Zn(2)-Cys(6) binuclear cluster domain